MRLAPCLLLIAISACVRAHPMGDAGSPVDSGPVVSDSGPPSDAGVDAGADAGIDAGRVPLNHRPAGMMCNPDRPTVVPDGGFPGGGKCIFDSDCTDGGPGTRDGRCVFDFPDNYAQCNYDTCEQDSDCHDGGPCQCGSAVNFGANACLPGNCQVDSDCGDAATAHRSSAAAFRTRATRRSTATRPTTRA